jgi:hypothetical protein
MKTYTVDSNGCWIWPAKNKYAYGPKRRFYLQYNGPIPEGFVIMHTCDVRNCVNPKHLVLGTHIQNMVEASGPGQLKKLLAGQIKEKNLISRLRKKRQEIIDITGWR